MGKVQTTENKEVWPIGSNYFSVKMGDLDIPFQIVSGLKTRLEVVEYRSGNSKTDSVVKMPLTATYSDIILRKGMFSGDSRLIDLFNEINFTKVTRKTIIIQLLDDTGTALFTWTLNNAFPREISFGEFDAMNATYAVEEMVIAHEGLSIDLN